MKPFAARYRNRKLLARALLITTILGFGMLSTLRIGGTIGMFLALIFVLCALVATFVLAFGMNLICPHCKKRLEPATGNYCPVCGSDRFEFGRHQRGPHISRYAFCPDCGSKIDEGGGDLPRSYRICHCTHCGSMVDEAGL